MRIFTTLFLISVMPLSLAFADVSDYHQVHFGDAGQPPEGTMNYWDDGGYARTMLMGSNLMDSGTTGSMGGTMIHQSRLDYTPDLAPSVPSDSIDIHSRPSAASIPDDSANSVQP